MISFKESLDGTDTDFCFSLDLESRRVIVQSGNTSVMAYLSVSYQSNKRLFSESGCKPLTVSFDSRFNAINKIPGGFKKKDVVSDNDIVLSRLVDRCIRPLIPSDFDKDISLYLQVLTYYDCSLEVLSVLASSLSLLMAGIIDSPVSLVKISGQELNLSSRKDQKFRFLAAFNQSTIENIEPQNVMIDYSILEDLSECNKSYRNKQIELYEEILKKSFKIASSVANDINKLQSRIVSQLKNDSLVKTEKYKSNSVGFFQRNKAWNLSSKFFQRLLLSPNCSELLKEFDSYCSDNYIFNSYVRELIYSRFVEHVLKNKIRLDDRDLLDFDSSKDIRNLSVIHNLVNSKNQYTLLSKGKTEVICSLCVSDSSNAQMVDSLDGKFYEKLIVNYNFLPNLVNDVRKIGCSRREIGHSDLIKKSFKSLVCDNSKVARIVLDVVSSDGGSSMIGVCATSMLLCKENLTLKLIAGLSIGMIHADSKKKFLVDLTHAEDEFLSIIDCKIIGNTSSINAIQLDSKRPSLVYEDFVNLLKIFKLKIHTVIDSIKFSENKKSFLYKKNLEENQNIELPGLKVKKFIIVFIDTELFRKKLVDKNIKLYWLAQKLKVDITIEDSSKLKISSYNHTKLSEAENYIKNFIR